MATLRVAIYSLGFDLIIDVTQNADDESLAASQAGQPRGDCPYLKNLDSVGAAPQGAALNFGYRRNSICVR
jgi:hypothetical protein